MPTFEISSPDGKRYRVTAPDGATQDEVLAYVQRQQADKPRTESPRANEYPPTEGEFSNAIAALGKIASETVAGGQQMVARPLRGLGFAKSWADRLDREHEERERLDGPLMDTLGGKLGYVAGMLLPGLGFASRIPRAAGVISGAQGALIPTANETERAVNAGLSGALGFGAQAGFNRLAGVRTPKAAGSQPAADAMERGYDLTYAQRTGSKTASGLEQMLANAPGSAGLLAKHRGAQGEQFAADVLATLGEPANAVVTKGAPGISRSIGDRLESAASGVGMQVDVPLAQGLVDVEREYLKNLVPDQRRIVREYIDDIVGKANGFTGEQYQKWRSRIGKRAAEAGDSELKGALKGIQRALDDAFDRQAPDAARSSMTKARGEYRNFKTIEPLISRADSVGSDIAPSAVARRTAVTGNTRGELGELGRVGQVIGNQYPNSGTPTQQLWQRAVQGAPLVGLGFGGSVGGIQSGDATGSALGAGTGLALSLLAPYAAGRGYLAMSSGGRVPEARSALAKVLREAAKKAGPIPGRLGAAPALLDAPDAVLEALFAEPAL